MGFSEFSKIIVIFEDLKWIFEFLRWLLSPSIVPVAGAVAAILAALTVEPQTWMKSPLKKGILLALRVAVIFLIAAWLFSRPGCGRGSGEGDGHGSGTGKPHDNTPGTRPITVVSDQVPPGTPGDYDLVVIFVPEERNERVARAFSCDLFHAGTKKTIQIRASNMHEFDTLLVQRLRDLRPHSPRRMTVHIKRSPFPGAPALQLVRDKVLEVIPNATVDYDE